MEGIDTSALVGSTVLVTGGAGFIGSHMTERLLGLGARVVVLDNRVGGHMSNLAQPSGAPQPIFVRGDANRFGEIAAVFSSYKIDYVFHYAAVVGVKNVIERPLEVFEDIDGIKYLLALSNAHRVRKVVFASSSEAYGEPTELPEREDGHHNVNVNDPYGLTKLVGENMMRNYWRRFGLPTTSLRFFNVYGPRQNASAYGFVVGIFIQKVLAGEPLTVYGSGGQTRDFIYIEDNIEAGIRALLTEASHGMTINVGSGRQTTILELAERISRLAGVEPRITMAPEREVEVRYRCPDVTKMQQLLGFTTRIPLEDGLGRTFAWYKEHFHE